MATADEREQLRRLTTTASTTDDAGAVTYALSDEDANRLLAAWRCPKRPGDPLDAADGGPDVYGAAAAWWEEQALRLEAAQLDAGSSPAVKRATVGDTSVEYAGSSPQQLFAIARRLWRRSCQPGRGRAYTVDVLPSMGTPPASSTPTTGTWDDSGATSVTLSTSDPAVVNGSA